MRKRKKKKTEGEEDKEGEEEKEEERKGRTTGLLPPHLCLFTGRYAFSSDLASAPSSRTPLVGKIDVTYAGDGSGA